MAVLGARVVGVVGCRVVVGAAELGAEEVNMVGALVVNEHVLAGGGVNTVIVSATKSNTV
jgi:hypothetical protein